MLGAKQLGSQARKIIANVDNFVLVSAATLWEIAIKQRKGALTEPAPASLAVQGEVKAPSRDSGFCQTHAVQSYFPRGAYRRAGGTLSLWRGIAF